MLLVIDSYGDLVYLESLLKKIGFDTIGLKSSLSLGEQLLGFSPEVLVMSGKGSKVNGIELSRKIKKRKGQPRIILLFPKDYQPQPQELAGAQMDAVFEVPLDPVRFLTGLCNLIGQDSAQVLEKFSKLQGFESSVDVSSSHVIGPSPMVEKVPVSTGAPPPWSQRSQYYQEIAAQVTLPGPGGFNSERIQAAAKEMRREHGAELDEELDASRREFVRALFSKGR